MKTAHVPVRVSGPYAFDHPLALSPLSNAVAWWAFARLANSLDFNPQLLL